MHKACPMIGHWLKANYQKEPFLLALSNAWAAFAERKLGNKQLTNGGATALKTWHKSSHNMISKPNIRFDEQ